MEKMWAGRTDGATDRAADDFNSSIRFDARMYAQDIKGSMAHATMLAAKHILSDADADTIVEGLEGILHDLENGTLQIDPAAEDIHMFIESVLTSRIGDAGKRLHTARSRNDQVALDLRMTLRDSITKIRAQNHALIEALCTQAKAHTRTVMPGYTHLQRAQPIVLAQHLLAYVFMLIRDDGRLEDTCKRMNRSPLGSCALAGTTYPIDRHMTAAMLEFDGPTENSLDGVSDRDFCVELLSACSILQMHLSRLSEELLLWSSWEFGYVTLDDAYTTGSSIMPQKKNADMAELIRGKTGRVYGDLMGTLTMLKGLPLAYNKDMQEDKESVFDAVDTVSACLGIMTPMIRTAVFHPDVMYAAAQRGFINATDLADYLTKRGVPFRSAYKTVGRIIRDCIANHAVPEDLPLEVLQTYDGHFSEDVYDEIRLENCIEKRISSGGTGPESVAVQLATVSAFLAKQKK